MHREGLKRDVDPKLMQCWANVVDGGPTLKQHSHNISCEPLRRYVNKLNFHPLDVVSRYRDPQHQVGEKLHIFV